jgi:hypothetical protein
MQDIGTLPGDFQSGAIAINDSDQMTGVSIGPDGPRAVIWKNGSIADLNTLVSPTPLHLLFGNGINDSGEIAGVAIDIGSGEMHAYVARLQGNEEAEQHDNARLFSADGVRRVLRKLGPLSHYGVRFAPGW